jgi:hypothetical protein
MHRILPFPHKALKVSKVWNDDLGIVHNPECSCDPCTCIETGVTQKLEMSPRAVADFKRVCDAMGLETREDGA